MGLGNRTDLMSVIRRVIVGTAGHIDHGKSALVQALTGTHPDRLTEEQERGMTIDLGFAPYVHRSGDVVGIIDVPGHERFIRNMVAGASSVDLALLVVAADDGVMPQTREHLDILRLLGTERGILVVTKTDIVDGEMVELVKEDLRGFVAGSFLENAPCLCLSSLTGEGIEELKKALDDLLDEIPNSEETGPFRLPVQRVFSKAGHGTVVTGVPLKGTVSVGDALQVVDSGQPIRVRGIHAYGTSQESGRAGHSTALNVTGVSKSEVCRGMVVASPGIFRPHSKLLVSYAHFDQAEPLGNGHPVKMHLGTAEVMGRAVVLDQAAVEYQEEAFLQVRLESPVVTSAGDRYLLRHAASLRLLGGGVVLDGSDGRLKRFKERVLGDARRRLEASSDSTALVGVTVLSASRRGVNLESLSQSTGCSFGELAEILQQLESQGDVVRAGKDLFVDLHSLEEVGDELVALLGQGHREQPLRSWLDVGYLRSQMDLSEEVLQSAMDVDVRIERDAGGRVRVQGHAVTLGDDLLKARERILDGLKAGGLRPPVVDEVLAGIRGAELDRLLEMLRQAGEVVVIGGHNFTAEVIGDLRDHILAHGRQREGKIDIPALRDEIGTTRKFLIPLLEYFDAEGVTVRQGDGRRLRGVIES